MHCLRLIYTRHKSRAESLKCHRTRNILPMKVRLFIKPYCGWCHKAIRWLDEHDMDYEVVDVMMNDAAFEEMVKLSGQELAPVLEADGNVLADFGPEELPGFFKRISSTS
jgi:glutaredoxin 3